MTYIIRIVSFLTLTFDLYRSKVNCRDIWQRSSTSVSNFRKIGLVVFEKSQREYSRLTNKPTKLERTISSDHRIHGRSDEGVYRYIIIPPQIRPRKLFLWSNNDVRTVTEPFPQPVQKVVYLPKTFITPQTNFWLRLWWSQYVLVEVIEMTEIEHHLP